MNIIGHPLVWFQFLLSIKTKIPGMCWSKTDINTSTIKLDIDCFNIKLTIHTWWCCCCCCWMWVLANWAQFTSTVIIQPLDSWTSEKNYTVIICAFCPKTEIPCWAIGNRCSITLENKLSFILFIIDTNSPILGSQCFANLKCNFIFIPTLGFKKSSIIVESCLTVLFGIFIIIPAGLIVDTLVVDHSVICLIDCTFLSIDIVCCTLRIGKQTCKACFAQSFLFITGGARIKPNYFKKQCSFYLP